MPKGRPKGFNEQVVLERAMQSFWREGYAGASMSILLNDMGISRQSLYDTYGDKRALFLKAIEMYVNREVGGLLDLLDGPAPARDRLLGVVDSFYTMAEEPHQRGCFIGNTLVALKEDDPELALLLNNALERFYQGLLSAIETAHANREIASKLSPSVLARGLLNSIVGLAATSKATPPPGAREESLAFITSTLLPAHS